MRFSGALGEVAVPCAARANRLAELNLSIKDPDSEARPDNIALPELI